ncbi:MAG: J domain-containing protein, partial [Sphingobacteriaceae bacterium]
MGQAESSQRIDDMHHNDKHENIRHQSYYSMPATLEPRPSTRLSQPPIRTTIVNRYDVASTVGKPPDYPREYVGQPIIRDELDSFHQNGHQAVVNSRFRNQPVSVFNVDDKMNEFDAEQKRLEEAMERVKARRLATFEKELKDFEASYNPFEVLGLSRPTDDINLVKKAYHKQSLKYHPDKGGDEQKFALITKAYMYIAKRIEKMNIKVASQIELKEQA